MVASSITGKYPEYQISINVGYKYTTQIEVWFASEILFI